MDLIRFSIQNPVKVTVGVLLTVLFGLMALRAVPIQLTPDVERPVVSVNTSWQGRSPEEIETSLLFKQEDKLKVIQGLYRMTSSASLGNASIDLEFNVGYDMGRAIQEVSNRLNEVRNYPEDVDRPTIRSSTSQSDEYIAIVLIQSENDPNFDIAECYDYLNRYVKPQIERIDGLSQVDVMGARRHEVQVRFDPVALAQSGVTFQEFQAAIRADNINESAGDLASGRMNYRFRVIGRFDSLEPLRNTVLKYVGASPIYVKDVADVQLVLKKNTYFNQSKGEPSLCMFFRRETGANVLSVISDLKKILAEIDAPNGALREYKNDRYQIRMRLVYDDSTYINSAIRLVQSNMYSGGVLAILVLLLFLRSPRPTLLISLTIPISLFGTFAVLYSFGRSVNVISLAGLTFAIGMVVDNAIVVLENIDRHLHLGKTPLRAAYDGTREVWGAILSSTLTTIAVFAPVLTVQEESGQLFYDIAIAVCAAILWSLVVSITVIPAASVRILRDTTIEDTKSRFKSLFGVAALGNWLTAKFADGIFAMTQRSPAGFWLRIMIVCVITFAACYLSLTMMPPASYLPNGNRNFIVGSLMTPPGYSLRQNILIGRQVQESLRPFWEAQTDAEAFAVRPVVDMRSGEVMKRVSPIGETWVSIDTSRVMAFALSADPQNVRPLIAVLGDTLNSIPGCTGTANQGSLFGRRSGSSVSIEVTGNDMIRLRESTAYFQQRLVEIFSQAGVRSQPTNYILNGPELQLVIDQVRAKEYGLTLSQIGIITRAMVDGAYTGDFDYDGENIDLYVIRDPDIPLSPQEVAELPVAVRSVSRPGGTDIIPLSHLVKFVSADASQQIRRYEQQRSISLQVTPPDNMALEEAQSKVVEAFNQCRAEGGVTSDIRLMFAGSSDKLRQTREAMLGQWKGYTTESLFSFFNSRFFLSLLLTYLLMAALFESFLYPFVIMFSVPLAMTGGFLGLSFVHWLEPTQQMDTLAMLGFIILIGIVVNNAILIVHQSLNFMRGLGESEDEIVEKMPYREAIRESVRTRIRPILMTSATSIFGMLPLVVMAGAGSELYRGLGAVVLGGLACSTLFTLVLVPLLFSLVLDVQYIVFKKR